VGFSLGDLEGSHCIGQGDRRAGNQQADCVNALASRLEVDSGLL
jgi:hypothetical protein